MDVPTVESREYHVSTDGSDDADGTAEAPLATISAAASRATPGDVVTVHEGTYRERVDPPRGGTADDARIVYRAGEGDRPEIKGSEVVEDWESTGDGVWKTTLADEFFGEYNPYDDRIRGDWFDDMGRDHHTGDVYIDGQSLREAATREDVLDSGSSYAWYSEVDDGRTTIWADFGQCDPDESLVEITVRPAVFYPGSPGVDYITVRGFRLRHAATQWAPPTTEQIGLLGTHWSRGWIIEDNVVSDSRCTGITLGKYGESVDDTGASAERYNQTIRDVLDSGWERGSVGHHVVRGNTIYRCEQAGIVGSMGAAFSEVTDNHVYDINVEGQFGGAELAGIKFHGAIDATIGHNRVHRAPRGIWLDWMTQGTRVTGNLLYDNDDEEDLFLEVNHGPFVVDNNVLLSDEAILDWSQGGAYVHNLVAGAVGQSSSDRSTPFHEPRSTSVAGLSEIQGGDDRFYNNVFVGHGLSPYDDAERPVWAGGNVYLGGAEPPQQEDSPVRSGVEPDLSLVENGDGVSLRVSVDDAWANVDTELVTTRLLRSAAVPDAPYTEPDGTTLRVDTDYFGTERDEDVPAPGPFARLNEGTHEFDVW